MSSFVKFASAFVLSASACVAATGCVASSDATDDESVGQALLADDSMGVVGPSAVNCNCPCDATMAIPGAPVDSGSVANLPPGPSVGAGFPGAPADISGGMGPGQLPSQLPGQLPSQVPGQIQQPCAPVQMGYPSLAMPSYSPCAPQQQVYQPCAPMVQQPEFIGTIPVTTNISLYASGTNTGTVAQAPCAPSQSATFPSAPSQMPIDNGGALPYGGTGVGTNLGLLGNGLGLGTYPYGGLGLGGYGGYGGLGGYGGYGGLGGCGLGGIGGFGGCGLGGFGGCGVGLGGCGGCF